MTSVNPLEKPECKRYRKLTSTPLSEIRRLPKHEFVRRFDERLAQPHPPCNFPHLWLVGPDDYRDESHRRSTDRAANILIGLTALLFALTVVLTVLTKALYDLELQP